jgi:hypothetical protein
MAQQDRGISLIPILPDLPPRRKRKMLNPSHGGALPVPLSKTAYCKYATGELCLWSSKSAMSLDD